MNHKANDIVAAIIAIVIVIFVGMYIDYLLTTMGFYSWLSGLFGR